MKNKKWHRIISVLLALFLLLVLGACGQPKEIVPQDEAELTPEEKIENNKNITADMVTLYQAGETAENTKIVVIETSLGAITLTLYPDEAPKAVENFIALAKSGYYNGLKFHRVLADYFVQSGDPTGSGNGGESSFVDENGSKVGFEIEPSLNLWNFYGALGMSPSADGTNGSQFYIITSKRVDGDMLSKLENANFPEKVIEHYKEVGGAPWLDQKQTVFGQVTEGMEVLEKIAAVETDENNVPKEDIIITSITVQES